MKFSVKVDGETVFVNGTRAKRTKMGVDGSRKIYAWGKYIVKIEDDDNGCRNYFHQCQHEHKLWPTIAVADQRYFVPILYYKHTKQCDCVIQPRIDLSRCRNSAHKDLWDKVVEPLLDRYGLDDFSWDLQCNWGILTNGKPIIYDYGL